TLDRELETQVLSSGEHFERAPMYHLHVLDALLDVRDVFQSHDEMQAAELAKTTASLARFAQQILHPDGEIPLLGDSALGEAPPARELIQQAGVPMTPPTSGPRSAPRSRLVGDYWTWSDGGDFLVLDAGSVGADELPAHAHSDLTTFEASIAGHRVIV